jgi:hypothetical protein
LARTISEIDTDAFSIPPGTGSSKASNVKAIATTASVKNINR